MATTRWETQPEPDPVLAKVTEGMTTLGLVTTASDNKLDRMLHIINSNMSQHLNEIGARFDGAKGRILVVENIMVEADHLLNQVTRRANRACSGPRKSRSPKESKDPGIMWEGGGQRRGDVYGTVDPQDPGYVDQSKSDKTGAGAAASRLPRAMIVRFHNFWQPESHGGCTA